MPTNLPAPPILDAELLRQRLTLRKTASEQKLLAAHATAKEFFENIGLRPGKIREHAAKILTSGALAGSLLLSTPGLVPLPGTQPATPTGNTSTTLSTQSVQLSMAKFLQATLPPVGNWDLSGEQEEKIRQKLREIFGINAYPDLEGNRLLNSYGRMGAEQHLPRYPGDTISEHQNFTDKGITPGLGGWGYFANSKEELTPQLIETEKYYVALPIIYLPDFQSRTKHYVDWYKYRRVVVVNPANGKAVIAAVADAGPANWTGKHFGGSPEVLAYLDINYGMQNHPVIVFFLDDPKKEIPLGPLEYNWQENQKTLVNKS